jgi:hypothetical protein
MRTSMTTASATDNSTSSETLCCTYELSLTVDQMLQKSDGERTLFKQGSWWDPRADRWELAFRRRKAYVKHCGDARVPDVYKIDGYHLARGHSTCFRSEGNP